MSNEPETVKIETTPQGFDQYVIDGEPYFAHASDTPEKFLKHARHYQLIAAYLDSPEQQEHQRLKARREEIAQRYGIDPRSPYYSIHPTQAMIEDILKLEEAAK